MKKILLSSLCALALTACGGGGDDPIGNTKNGLIVTESGFYESSSTVIGQKFLNTVTDTVNFGYNSFELTPEAKVILDEQVVFLTENKGVKIVLEGHADERGTREYNLALGNKRASIVSLYLQVMGVEKTMIEVISYGKERPLAESHTQEAWAKNRRVVTVIK